MKKMKRTNVFKTLFTSAIILGAVAGGSAVSAQDYDSMIGETQNAINNLSASQAALYEQLTTAYSQLEAIQAEAGTLLTSIATDEAQIKELEAQIDELSTLIAKRESLLADQARAVQTNGGSINYVNLVASSNSISDFVGRVDVVRKMVNANKDLINEQKADKEAVETKKATVEATKQNKVNKMAELETLKSELAAQSAEAEAVYNQLTSDITLAAAQRDALVAEKAAFEEAQALAAAQAAQAAELAAAQAAAEATQPAEVTPAPEQPVATEATEEVATETPATEVAPETEAVAEATPAQEQPVAPETTEEVVAPEAPATEVPAEPAAPAVEEAPAVEQPAEEPAQEQPVVEDPVVEEPVAEATPSYGSNYGDVISTAAKYLGTPYVWGGKSPSGFDCSGFVQYVFKEAYGIDVGGWTVPQESSGTKISVAEAQAGDLYFWGSPGGTYHVAIATGGGNYIHASQPGTPLEYNSIQYFTPDFAVRVR